MSHLTYRPEGDAIVIHNGTRTGNRPLYCNHRDHFALAGEMPQLDGPVGSMRVGVIRSGKG